MKNVKGKILGRKVLSFILTATLVLGLMPGNILTVSAEGTDTAVTYTDVVASITNGETVTNYATFADALANWSDGTTLTLLADVTGLTERIKTYAKGLILDLNGHKIECSDTLCTIWIDGASGSELTIRDSLDGGHINGVVYAVNVGSKLCLESGTVETVDAHGDFTMTGGQIISEDDSGLYVQSEGDVVISGGEIYGSEYGVQILRGNVIISGDTKITGADQYAIRSNTSTEVVISGTPTISGGAGELFLNSKITLNTQPADGKVWRVRINTAEITDGIFAVPGEGIALDASKFASAMDGYEVKQNAKGELLLCNHTEQTAVSNGDGTHNTACNCGEVTFDTNVACSGGVATDTHQAYCEYCNAPYGELNPDVHYDIIALTMTTEELEDALLELLNSGETDISILLAGNADEEMFTAINTALCSSTAAKGSVNLTIAGVQVVTTGALGNGDPNPELNTDPVALKTLNFPDAVTLKINALVLPKVQAVYLPKVTEWEPWGIDADNISTLVLTAPGTITADFYDLCTNDIDLTLHCNKINDVTDGTTWQGVTWKSISFEHSYTCTATSTNVITKECANCGKSGTLTITAEGGVYDGETAYGATVEKTGIFENEEVIVDYYKGDTSIGTDAPVDAGTYTAKITYEDVTASCQFTIEKVASVITAAPTPIADLVYGGTAYYLINAGTATGGTMLYSLEEDGEYSTSIPQGLNAGDYTIWYKVDGDENHNDTTPASIEVTIAPKTLEIGTVTASARAFDGTNIVEISEIIIDGVRDADNVSVSATATINSINVGEYSTVDLSGITLTGDAASNYSIVASAEDVDLVPTVTISKAAAPTLSRGSKAYVYNQSYEGEFVSITGVPTDCGGAEYVLLSVSGNMLKNISVDRSSGEITYDVKALDSYTEDLQGTIDVNVEMENYETAFYKLTITRRDKYAVTVQDGMSVSLETNELTYGQRLGELAFNEVTFVGEAGEVVDGTLRWENSNEVPDVAIDKASWRFIPESDAYKEVVGTLDITVKQAPLVVEAVPVVADRVYNPSVKLADVALSGGTVKDAYGDTIEGTWSWVNSDTVPTVVNDGYEAVFTPVDVNYETVTGTIMVTVTKATPDIGTVSVLDAELENTTDISMVVLKRTDESMAGTLELTAEALLYGAHGYVWKFTPQDLNNYEELTGTVAIEVKDTIAPVASYKIGTGDWESFGISTTYETFSKERLSVEIKAEDSGSGIASVQYYVAAMVSPSVSESPLIPWLDYTEAITLDANWTYVIYVKVTDNGGNVVIQNSEGIVIYADSEITTPELNHTYKEEADEEAVLKLNANTFAKITDAEGAELVRNTDYIVTQDSGTLSIEMQSEYLATLDAGEHTYYVSVNPQGV